MKPDRFFCPFLLAMPIAVAASLPARCGEMVVDHVSAYSSWVIHIDFDAMRASGAGNDGSTTATADVPAWLEFDWNLSLPGLEDPVGTAVFGIFRGVDRRIYIRELY